MKCSHVKIDGQRVILCGSGRIDACETCEAPAGFQCDWRMPGGWRCDKTICNEHAHQVGKNKHLCPEHWEAWQTHPANKQKDLFS